MLPCGPASPCALAIVSPKVDDERASARTLRAVSVRVSEDSEAPLAGGIVARIVPHPITKDVVSETAQK